LAPQLGQANDHWQGKGAMATAEDQKGPRDALKTTGELFRYSSWVHIGGGAEDCEEAETGTCADPLHFHAWCRLPNQLQHADIRERALASKARRIRQATSTRWSTSSSTRTGGGAGWTP
jgi:hypothetical protein